MTADAPRSSELLFVPPSVGAMAVMLFWCMPLLIGGGFVLFAVIATLGVILTGLTVYAGAHPMVLVAGGYLFWVAVASSVVVGWSSALAWWAIGASLLLYIDLIRLAFVARRRAVVHSSVAIGSLAGTALTAALSLLMVTIATGLADGSSRSWLWVPAATAVLVIGLIAILTLAGRRSTEHDARRWNPGERLPPPPIAL